MWQDAYSDARLSPFAKKQKLYFQNSHPFYLCTQFIIMLELASLRNTPQEIKDRLSKRGKSFDDIIDEVLAIDVEKRKAQKELDDALAVSNQISAEFGALMKAGRKEDAEILRVKSSEQKELVSSLKETFQKLESSQEEILFQIPNAPQLLVKSGKNSEENEIVKVEGLIPDLGENALAHWDLGKNTHFLIQRQV